MDDISSLLFDAAERLLIDLSAESAPDETQYLLNWRKIEEMGLPLALVDTERGGIGLEPRDAFELIRVCGRHVTPFPIVETMLSNRFAADAGTKPNCDAVSELRDLSERQREFAALGRAVQMTGALETILSMTVEHVQDRCQFGRPLAKFQVIQHSLARLAGEVAAAAAAGDHAVSKLAEGGDASLMATAIARTRIGEACSMAASTAHQMHGAIGYAREHRLQLYTTALWKWRDEFGSQASWTRLIGRMVLAKGRDSLWPMVTAA